MNQGKVEEDEVRNIGRATSPKPLKVMGSHEDWSTEETHDLILTLGRSLWLLCGYWRDVGWDAPRNTK